MAAQEREKGQRARKALRETPSRLSGRGFSLRSPLPHSLIPLHAVDVTAPFSVLSSAAPEEREILLLEPAFPFPTSAARAVGLEAEVVADPEEARAALERYGIFRPAP